MATKTEQGQEKQGLWGKIQDWYAQPGIQMAVGMVYSIGAAVVIVGALFKIMHWPGAGVMLTAGMMTEAILFTIGIFEKPHATYHWEHVFPSLVEEEANPLNISGNIVHTFFTKLSVVKSLDCIIYIQTFLSLGGRLNIPDDQLFIQCFCYRFCKHGLAGSRLTFDQ
jgi:hypothetical protein